MRKMLALGLCFFSFFASAQTVQESHFCQTNFINNEYTGHQSIKITRDVATSNIIHVYFEKSFSFNDFLIYRRGTNELMGDRVYLPIPPFIPFESWVKQCQKNIIRQCNMDEYNLQKESHHKDKAWVLETFEIGPDHPEFYLVWSKFIVTQSLAGDTILTQNSGYNGRYSFKEDLPLDHKVRISNQNQKDHLYIQSSLWGFFTMLDSEKSYSPFLEIKFEKGGKFSEGSRLTQPCNK